MFSGFWILANILNSRFLQYQPQTPRSRLKTEDPHLSYHSLPAAFSLCPLVGLGQVKMPGMGLIVKQPWADLIVDARKSWELRGSASMKRERIAIVQAGSIIGEVNMVGCVKIAERREDWFYQCLLPMPLDHYKDCHHVSDFSMFKYKSIFAWVFNHPYRYIRPRKIDQKRGAIVWVKLSDSQHFPAAGRSSSKVHSRYPSRCILKRKGIRFALDRSMATFLLDSLDLTAANF